MHSMIIRELHELNEDFEHVTDEIDAQFKLLE